MPDEQRNAAVNTTPDPDTRLKEAFHAVADNAPDDPRARSKRLAYARIWRRGTGSQSRMSCSNLIEFTGLLRK